LNSNSTNSSVSDSSIFMLPNQEFFDSNYNCQEDDCIAAFELLLTDENENSDSGCVNDLQSEPRSFQWKQWDPGGINGNK